MEKAIRCSKCKCTEFVEDPNRWIFGIVIYFRPEPPLKVDEKSSFVVEKKIYVKCNKCGTPYPTIVNDSEGTITLKFYPKKKRR